MSGYERARTREREPKMTDQEHTFELATGTVPDPFGLGWDLEREASEEDGPPPAVPTDAAPDPRGLQAEGLDGRRQPETHPTSSVRTHDGSGHVFRAG